MQPSHPFHTPSLADCLRTAHTPLTHLLQQIQKIQQANVHWFTWNKALQYAPCCVAHLTLTRLVLKTNHGPVAHALRFEAPDILQHFQKHPAFQGITQILVRVYPFSQNIPTTSFYTPPPPKPLTPATQALLSHTALTVDHPALKAALMRLAQHKCNK